MLCPAPPRSLATVRVSVSLTIRFCDGPVGSSLNWRLPDSSFYGPRGAIGRRFGLGPSRQRSRRGPPHRIHHRSHHSCSRCSSFHMLGRSAGPYKAVNNLPHLPSLLVSAVNNTVTGEAAIAVVMGHVNELVETRKGPTAPFGSMVTANGRNGDHYRKRRCLQQGRTGRRLNAHDTEQEEPRSHHQAPPHATETHDLPAPIHGQPKFVELSYLLEVGTRSRAASSLGKQAPADPTWRWLSWPPSTAHV